MQRTHRLFPAHAGVIPTQPPLLPKSFTFPRTRGGDPKAAKRGTAIHNFSPHTRG